MGDAQLKPLIVGKASWVRNNATGEQFDLRYTAEGNTNVWHVGSSATLPSSVGNIVRNGYEGTTSPYKIEGGKVVTNISQDPFSVTIYKLGDTYYGARSNEFGYANYEIIQLPSPPIVSNPLQLRHMEERLTAVSCAICKRSVRLNECKPNDLG